VKSQTDGTEKAALVVGVSSFGKCVSLLMGMWIGLSNNEAEQRNV
jgi:hypothetical protein